MPRPIWLTAGGAGVAAGAVALAAGQGGWAAVLVAAGILLAVIPILQSRIDTRAGDLDVEKVADRLADLVRDQWDIEATRRGVGRPPLEVFWEAVDADLVHTWPELLAQAATGRSGPASATPGGGPDDLAGHGALIATYDQAPCGRLVVLGEPGAGKTVLLLRLVLDLLARRQSGQPVPLLLPLASWNPDEHSPHGWLETQIIREYPHLSAKEEATGNTRAAALLNAGLIIPVLDGLDEIKIGSGAKVLAAINDGLRSNIGLVLSSRPKEFRAAVHSRPDWLPLHLDGATGINLMPLTPTSAGDFLLAAAGPDGPNRWRQTLTTLTDSASPVARALTTPLTVSLANTIYNPRPRESILDLPNPNEICSLPTAVAIEQHLLAGFISAAYRPHPDRPTRWSGEQAAHYLTFLAKPRRHDREITSIEWWTIDQTTPRIYRALISGIGYSFANTLPLALIVGVPLKFAFGSTIALGVGSAAIALLTLLVILDATSSTQPRRITLKRVGVLDLILGALNAFLISNYAGIPIGLASAILIWLTKAVDHDRIFYLQAPTSPSVILREDRRNTILNATLHGAARSLIMILFGKILFDFVPSIEIYVILWIAMGITCGLDSAWGRLGLTRLWLAARRKQPLHLIAFLEDAHARGVLRQAGAVWEFRHANLQRYLANRPR